MIFGIVYREDGNGTNILLIRDNAVLPIFDHGVWLTYWLLSFHSKYSAQSEVGLSHGNSGNKYYIDKLIIIITL